MTKQETSLRQAGKQIRFIDAVVAMAALILAIAALRLTAPGYASTETHDSVLTAPHGDPPASDDVTTVRSCNVRALRLTFDGSSAVLELQNDGGEVVLRAITLGWPVENGALTRIQLNELVVWQGEASGGSFTAFPPLSELRPYLAPGEPARLVFTFRAVAQDGAYTVLLDFGDGCYTFFSTLSTGFTVQDNCGLQQVQAVAGENRILFRLQNVGTTATLPVRLTLEWPSGQVLRTVMWGASTLWSGEQLASPFTVGLGDAAIAPLQPGEATTLTMAFASPVAVGENADYKAILTTDTGCQAEFSLLRGTCNITARDFQTRGEYATLILRNDGLYRTQPVLLAVFLPEDAPLLQEVAFGERSFAPETISPVTVPLRELPPLDPGASVPVRLGFDGPAPPRGYVVVTQFDHCIAVYSDVRPSAECPVSLDRSPYISGNVFGMRLRNASAEAIPLETIWLSFPEENGGLNGVNLNDEPLWTGIDTSPATFTAGVNLKPAAVPSGTARLDFVFMHPVATGPYAVELGFPNGCRVLYTTRGQNPTPCQVGIPEEQPLVRDGNTLRLRIQNSGTVAAELSVVAVRWQESTNGRLLRLTLNDHPIWEGEATGGSATLTPSSGARVPVIEPGTTAMLGLTFDRTPPDAPYGLLGAAVEFVEGCRAVFEPSLPPPGPVEIDGVVAELPANVYDGIWRIQVPGSDTLLDVRVTDRTVIEPAGVQPQVGDRVSVTAIPEDAGFVAIRIRVAPRVAEPVEFIGLIEAVDLERIPPTIQVQGITVVITETTLINQEEPVVGWIAHVIGDRRPDGTVLARRVEVINPEQRQQVEFSGVVEGYNPDCDICEPQQSLWVISDVRVIVDAEKTILHGIQPGEPPELGTEVLVRGLYQPNGTVLATELWYGDPEEGIVEFEGVIYRLPDDPNLLGTWEVLNTATNELIPVEVTEDTFIVIVDTFPARGVPVRVRAQKQPDGTLRALRIEILPTATSS